MSDSDGMSDTDGVSTTSSDRVNTSDSTSTEADERAGTSDSGDGIHSVRASGLHRNWNGIHYKTGLSAKNVPARRLSMDVARIPPGGVAFAHVHVDFEVMLYILQGTVRHDYGPNLRYSMENRAGDFIFIEPGVPHEVVNVGDTEDVVAVVARSDASEWERIVDYDRETGALGPCPSVSIRS